MTNQGELYMTVAFSNAGNRDAALLRVEPAYWGSRENANLEWIPLSEKVHADIPVTVPKTPMVVKAGGVELVTLSAKLPRGVAEQTDASSQAGAYVGVRVATMNSDGNLYLLQHSVARLVLDQRAEFAAPSPRFIGASAGSSTSRARHQATCCSPTRRHRSSGRTRNPRQRQNPGWFTVPGSGSSALRPCCRCRCSAPSPGTHRAAASDPRLRPSCGRRQSTAAWCPTRPTDRSRRPCRRRRCRVRPGNDPYPAP